jgi:hypothetical protein
MLLMMSCTCASRFALIAESEFRSIGLGTPPTRKFGCGFLPPKIACSRAERVQVMRDGDQVYLRRQLVRGMSPVRLGKDTELARLDEIGEFLLHVAEMADRRARVGAQCLCQLRGPDRVGGQRRYDIDPVQRMQVIEVHHVIVDVLRTDHQVADQLRVLRHLRADGIFHGPYRGDAVDQRADAADALRERPGVARIAVFQNDFDASHHRAGRIRLRDLIAVHLRFDA